MGALLKMLMKLGVKKFYEPLEKALEAPYEAQEKLLLKIVKNNKDTLFGKKYRLGEVTSIKSYQERVPVLSYSDYKPLVKKIIQGNNNILTPSKTVHLAQTSGTTGTPKILPLSADSVKEFSRMSGRIFASYINERSENRRVLDGKFLLFMAPAVDYYLGKLPVGYISGINAVNQNIIFQKMVIPPLSILNEKDWNLKFYKTAQIAIKSDVTLAGGVTPLLLSLFQKIMDDQENPLTHDYLNWRGNDDTLKKGLSKIWPHFRVLLHSGVNVKPYLNWMNELFDEQVDFRDCYGATEGVFAFQIGESEGMVLNIDTYFYEFVTEDDLRSESPRRYLVDELKKGKRYSILVTTSNGLYTYLISDIVEVVDTEPLTIKIVGRIGNEISLAGEKVTEKNVSDAIYDTVLSGNLQIKDFSIVPLYHNKLRYRFLIEFKKPPKDPLKFLKELDEALSCHNEIYRQCREMGLIDNPELAILPPGTYQKYKQEQATKGRPIGQIKIPHITSNDLVEGSLNLKECLDLLSY